MIDTTSLYKQWITEGNQNWQALIECSAKNSSEIKDTWNNSDLLSFEYADGCVADVFEIGATYAKNITFTLQNFDYHFMSYPLSGARLKVKIGLAPEDGNYESENIQWLDKGYFNVINSPNSKSKRIEIIAMDDMVKFNVPFTSKVSPMGDASDGESPYVTLKKLVINICNYCGVDVDADNLDFPHNEYTLPNDYYTLYEMHKYTCRDVLGFVAQFARGYARINNQGKLTICTFKKVESDEPEYDGGTFFSASTPYEDGIDLDGGDFETYAADEPAYTVRADGGSFSPKKYHAINALYSLEVSDLDRGFDGVIVESTYGGVFEHVRPQDATHLDSCIIIKDNPFIYRATIANTLADELYAEFVTNRRYYRQIIAEVPSDPSREAGDIYVISTPEGDKYWSIILNYVLRIGAADTITSDFDMDSDNSWNETENVTTNNE